MGVKRNPMVGELCGAAEGLSGTAATASLRRLGSIMEQAPSGRLFAAISTLSDMSAKAAKALEHGSHALEKARDGEAIPQLTAAVSQMGAMAGSTQISTTRSRKARRSAAG